MTRRAFILPLSLFLMLILVVLGFAFLGSSWGRYSASARGVTAAQARALAVAGMEDARLKLQRDLDFPPLSGMEQTVYSYRESLFEPGTNTLVGFYVVTIDWTHRAPPYSILRVSSTGHVGQDALRPKSNFTLYAEFDTNPDPSHDATRYRVMNWAEEQ